MNMEHRDIKKVRINGEINWIYISIDTVLMMIRIFSKLPCSTSNSVMKYTQWSLKGITGNFQNKILNPLQPGVAYLYPLKTSENVKVFCFQGV